MGTLLTRNRLDRLRAWLTEAVCVGREMKAPGKSLTDIRYEQPRVYVGYYPIRPLKKGTIATGGTFDYASAPAILIMFTPSKARDMEIEHFDRYNNIHRPQEFGGKLNISLLVSVYEPGTRLPGFDGNDPNGIIDESENGLFTLTDWMDDIQRALLAQETIPGTDMYVITSTIQYSPYVDGDYIADRRPYFYGMINLTFGYYAAISIKSDGAVEAALDEF